MLDYHGQKSTEAPQNCYCVHYFSPIPGLWVDVAGHIEPVPAVDDTGQRLTQHALHTDIHTYMNKHLTCLDMIVYFSVCTLGTF